MYISILRPPYFLPNCILCDHSCVHHVMLQYVILLALCSTMNQITSTPTWQKILKKAGVSLTHNNTTRTKGVVYPFAITYSRYKTIANVYCITERDLREGFAAGVIVDEVTLKAYIEEVMFTPSVVCLCILLLLFTLSLYNIVHHTLQPSSLNNHHH